MTVTHDCWKCNDPADRLDVYQGGWICRRHDRASVSTNSTGPKTRETRKSAENPVVPPTQEVSTSLSGPRSEVVSVDVDVDIGSPAPTPGISRTGSDLFADLETAALKLGHKPLGLSIPDDLGRGCRMVAADYAHVAGVYAVMESETTVRTAGVPYSQRWRCDVLNLPATAVRRALRELVSRGVLAVTGATAPQPGFPRGTKLYAPGPLVLERLAPPVESVADVQVQPRPPHDGTASGAEIGMVRVPGRPPALRDRAG
jgi:hypothetical protein